MEILDFARIHTEIVVGFVNSPAVKVQDVCVLIMDFTDIDTATHSVP